MLNRLERVGETLRAALNELATVAPDWLPNTHIEYEHHLKTSGVRTR